MTVTRADGVVVEYPSGMAAAKGEGTDQSTISELCRGARKASKGMKAKFNITDTEGDE